MTEWWASELLCIAAWIFNYITLGTAVTLTTEQWMVPSGGVLYGSAGGFPFLWDLNILVYERNWTELQLQIRLLHLLAWLEITCSLTRRLEKKKEK